MTALLTTDPRRIALAHTALALVAGALALAAVLILRATPTLADALSLAHGAILTVFVTLPVLFCGLGLWRMAVMIGAPGLAYPRAANLGAWLHGASLPTGAASLLLADARLALAALALMATCLMIGAFNAIATFLNMRAPGVTLAKAAPLAWATSLTGMVILTALPVMMAAAMDPVPSLPALRDIVWVTGQPHLTALCLLTLGVASSLLPPPRRRALAQGSLGMIAALGLVLWLQQVLNTGPMPDAQAMFRLTILIAAPFALLFAGAGWGLPRGPQAVWIIGMIAATAAGLLPLAEDMTARLHGILGLASVFATFGATMLWFPALTGRHLPPRMAYGQAVAMVAGGLLTLLPAAQPMATIGMALMTGAFMAFLGMAAWALAFGPRAPTETAEARSAAPQIS
ncbi:cbb3-type cytochrome c oxidase subunit I [Falsirhodobacter halotolerans]|uniref:cbb3-type cytochrome c oxidase subunit I n=1 Tax=Falsirhodobacter halotolerans TaxID=1146892 RepID=UPI001FD06DBE|nr:cbb3-type cytochrome c oxidase subunit I [Falsirhodobacter halotolerans]MCJ8140233.1 cbb3-type cytochrome c oxidase subunit I [Falsirhodobacter halotolerans]